MGWRLRRGLLGVGAMLLFAALVGFGSLPSWTISTSNAANGFGAGTLALSDTVTGTTCSATAATPAATCTTALSPATVAATPAAVTASVSSTGTLGANVGLSAPVCGLAQAGDATAGADTMVAHGGVIYQAAGPLGGSAIALDGTTGYFGGVNAVSGSSSFTETAWFETTGSGSIMSLANAPGDTGVTSSDQMLWLDSRGRLVAGIFPGTRDEIISPKSYNNGAWNFVAVTVGPAGFSFYVDGATVKTDKFMTAAGTLTGYWHLGWSDALQAGWADPPASAFFPGSLAGVGVYSGVLTGSQLNTLYASASLSAYSTAALADGPTAYWPLQDTGTVPYTGTVPEALGGPNLTAPGCSQVELTASLGGTCLYPSTGCAAATTSSTLTNLFTESSTTFVPAGTPETLALSYTEETPLPPVLVGVHVIGTLAVDGAEGWKESLLHPMDIELT